MATGSLLDELTNELAEFGNSSYIDEFVACGPKSYGYRIINIDSGVDRYNCKVKGISLNYRNAGIVNFESLKNQMTNENVEGLTVEDRLFVRDKDCSVRTVKRKKLCRPKSTKGAIVIVISASNETQLRLFKIFSKSRKIS